MTPSPTTTRLPTRLPDRLAAGVGAAAFAVAGVLFVVYPTLRPWADETTLDGAAGMASGAWVASHSAAMAGFLALTLAVGALVVAGRARVGAGAAATLLTWLGTGLVLPYYGAETFGLQVIGARAVADGDVSLLELAEAFRYGPVAMTGFGLGLLLLAAAGVALAVSLRDGDRVTLLGGVLTGLGLLLFLPQFFTPAPVRIAHGLLLGAGCVVLATRLWQRRHDAAARPAAALVTARD